MSSLSSGLTKKQTEKLGWALLHTRNNVYREAERMYGQTVGEEIFDDLEAAGFFKCEQCDVWKALDDKSPEPLFGDHCKECSGSEEEPWVD